VIRERAPLAPLSQREPIPAPSSPTVTAVPVIRELPPLEARMPVPTPAPAPAPRPTLGLMDTSAGGGAGFGFGTGSGPAYPALPEPLPQEKAPEAAAPATAAATLSDPKWLAAGAVVAIALGLLLRGGRP
jgi:hypothetical protein